MELEMLKIFFYSLYQMFLGFIKLIPDLFSMFSSLSKIANIFSPLGLTLIGVGIPVVLIPTLIFIIKFTSKKIIN